MKVLEGAQNLEKKKKKNDMCSSELVAVRGGECENEKHGCLLVGPSKVEGERYGEGDDTRLCKLWSEKGEVMPGT